VKFTGLPLEDVVPMASTVPASYLGIPPGGMVTAEWDPGACRLQIVDVRL
jgi:hypothetical protein